MEIGGTARGHWGAGMSRVGPGAEIRRGPGERDRNTSPEH